MGHKPDQQSKSINRRDVLQGIGGTAVTAAAAGTASAKTASESTFTEYEWFGSLETVMSALEASENGLLSMLSANGVLESDDLAELHVEQFTDQRSNPDLSTDITVEPHSVNPETGAKSPVLVTERETAEHSITFHYLPERDRSYALVTEKASDETFIYKSGEDAPQAVSNLDCVRRDGHCLNNNVCGQGDNCWFDWACPEKWKFVTKCCDWSGNTWSCDRISTDCLLSSTCKASEY